MKNVMIIGDEKESHFWYGLSLRPHVNLIPILTFDQAKEAFGKWINDIDIIAFDWKLDWYHSGIELVEMINKKFKWIMIAASWSNDMNDTMCQLWCTHKINWKSELPSLILSIINNETWEN